MNPGTSGLERGLAVLAGAGRRRGLEPRRPGRRAPGRAGRQRQEPDLAHARHAGRARPRRARPRHARLPHRLADLRAGSARRRAAPAGRAPRLLRGLVARLGESAHLSVRAGRQPAHAALGVAGERDPRAGVVGSLAPLATTSAGRALAFDLADDELDALGLAGDARADRRGARARLRDRARGVRARPRGRGRARARQRRARRRGGQRIGARLPLRARLEEAAAAVAAAADELSAELGAPRVALRTTRHSADCFCSYVGAP